MSKTGLNEEQIQYILNFTKEEGYVGENFNEDEFYSYLSECDEVDTIEEDNRRHWTEYIKIVDLGGRYFGIHDAFTAGDMSAGEKGFEPDDEIGEYKAVEIKTVTYKPI